MYVIKRGYGYVYSVDNEGGLPYPTWTISEWKALMFEDKEIAQKIADIINGAEVIAVGKQE